jgi:UDP-N-acetylglucosamine transferase subunit ALG13
MFPFDRLVRAVDQAVDQGIIEEPVFAQIGRSQYRARNFEAVPSLSRERFAETLRTCSAVVSHAGIGTLLACMEARKPLLVLPRRAAQGEHVNDHQIGTSRCFAAQGKLLLARDEEELARLLPEIHRFECPTPAPVARPLVNRIRESLRQLQPQS